MRGDEIFLSFVIGTGETVLVENANNLSVGEKTFTYKRINY